MKENKRYIRFFKSKPTFHGVSSLLCLFIFLAVFAINNTIGDAVGETWKFVLDVSSLLVFCLAVFFATVFGINVGDKVAEKSPKKAALVSNVLMVIGAISLCMSVAGSAIGIFRGYSMQGAWVTIAIFFGLVCFMIAGMSIRRVYLLSSAGLIMVLFSQVWGRQGKNYMRGQMDYSLGQYEQAVQHFRAETQTWYLRLVHNQSESGAMEALAKTYFKLGQYDKARETYELIIQRYPGDIARRAEQMLEEIKSGMDDPNALSP